MIRHFYIEGTVKEVAGNVAAKRVALGEWYVCTADHVFEGADKDAIVYHKDTRFRSYKGQEAS